MLPYGAGTVPVMRGSAAGRRNSHACLKPSCDPCASPCLEQESHRRPERPLLPKHVWAIRVRFELASRTRDLALFDLAFDSKLRGCDLVTLRVADVYAAGRMKERTSIMQSKTRQPVRLEITAGTRQSLLAWLGDPDLVGS